MNTAESQNKTTLTVAIIAKNEEKLLPICLESVKDLADEIVVVDTGSTDNTVEIARQFGAQIFYFAWTNDFAAARNKSINHATSDWILYLDADEIVTPENCRKIRETISRVDDALGISVKVLIPQPAGQIVQAFTFDYCRLFRNHPQIRFERPIHEQIEPSIRRLNGKIIQSDIVVHDHLGNQEQKRRKREKRNADFLLAESRKFPMDAFIRFNLGVTWLSLGEYASAIGEFGQALKYGQKSLEANLIATTYLFLGQAYLQVGNFSASESHSRQATQHMPNEPLPWFLLAMSAFKQQKLEPAIEYLQHVLALRRPDRSFSGMMQLDPAQVFLQLGNCYFLSRQLTEAQKYYQLALEKDPESWEINFKLGSSFFKTGDFVQARHFLEKTVKLNPELKVAQTILLKCIHTEIHSSKVPGSGF